MSEALKEIFGGIDNKYYFYLIISFVLLYIVIITSGTSPFIYGDLDKCVEFCDMLNKTVFETRIWEDGNRTACGENEAMGL